MLRLSREYVIQQIELLVDGSASRIGQARWTVRGIQCRRERHSHGGQCYSFDLDVLNLRTISSEDGRWELFIITEFWRSTAGARMHSQKWLRLIEGKAPDVFKWIRKHRENGTDAISRAELST